MPLDEEWTRKFCKDIFPTDAETGHRLVKPAVDGYIARHNQHVAQKQLEERRCFETAIYYASDNNLLARKDISIEDKRVEIIERLEQVYGPHRSSFA
jgi:hypothetical protein